MKAHLFDILLAIVVCLSIGAAASMLMRDNTQVKEIDGGTVICTPDGCTFVPDKLETPATQD